MIKRNIEYHKQRLTRAKEIGNKAEEGAAYGNLGNAYQSLGNFEQAIDYHKKHLSIAKELGQKDGEGAAYGNLGNAYQSLGDFKRAIEYHNLRLEIAKELGQRDGEGRAYGNLGNAYHSLGDFNGAIEYHQCCLSIVKELGQRDEEGRAYGNLGNAYQSLGEFIKAVDYHGRRLEISKELGDRAAEGTAYGNLGNAYKSLGDFKRAVEYQEKCLIITKELRNKGGEGATYGNLGIAYQSLGDFKQAIDYHKRQLSIAKELGQRGGEGCAYGNLGNAYQSLGDFMQAVEYHEQHLHHSLGHFNRAIEWHEQSLSIAKDLGQRDGEGAAFGNLGDAYRSLGDFKRALEYHKQELSIAKELGNKTREGAAFYSLGCDFEFSGSVHEALHYYRCSVKVYNDVRALLKAEDVWKISFRNACQHAYTALWRTLLKLQKTDEALCVAEQGRAQALADIMKLRYDTEFVLSGTISDILGVISTQTVFVALEGETIHLWVLSTDMNVQYRQETVYQSAVAFLEGVLNFRGYEDGNSLRLLHDCIIHPIADLLQGDELVIVPDGPLCLAPFAAFLDDESRYLCQSIRVRILPSLTTLKLITDSAEGYHKNGGVLLVGDPCLEEVRNTWGEPILLPLPYARKEVKVIGEMLKVSPLIGEEATKDEVLRRIGSVALVHIAAQGNIKTGEIALAPTAARTSRIPKEKDFMLKMSDVQAVNLHAKLVVLSYCHSAQGKVTPEGVVGIARAFLAAGARSVLVSVWAVDDEATMEFMKHFYVHLCDGCCASVALNLAMNCLRESERFGAAKYWAPFVLIGDDVTITFGENE